MSRSNRIPKMALLLMLCMGTIQCAWADDDEGEGRWWKWGNGERSRGASVASVPLPYQKECASCHIAYPAGLLPSGSWQHLMANLNQHFGNDASLDTTTNQAITQYLTSNAGTYKRVSEMPSQDRITQSSWFTRKHDKHVNPSTWARASIGSRANCVACHQGAEQGNFNEHSVRIPG